MISVRTLVATLAIASAVGAPALAAIAPVYRLQARNNAANVVVFSVTKVTLPFKAGTCLVEGKVWKVERGARYAVGQPITVQTYCSGRRDEIPDEGVYQDKPRLKASKWGRAYLGAKDGMAIEYNMLAQPSDPSPKLD
ncbi:hypothetical protein BH11PSE2_BH11PSE2_02640 [soil metagenome]